MRDGTGARGALTMAIPQPTGASPCEVLAGGYAQRWDPAAGWQQVTGSSAELDLLALNPSRGSRRERRARLGKGPWFRSGRHFHAR